MPPSVVRSVMGGTVHVKLRLVQWAGRTSLVRTQISRQRTSIPGVSTALSINTLIFNGTRQVSLPRRLSRVELIRHRRSLTRTVESGIYNHSGERREDPASNQVLSYHCYIGGQSDQGGNTILLTTLKVTGWGPGTVRFLYLTGNRIIMGMHQ